MNPRIQFKNKTALFFLAFALGCFALSPTVQAVTPAPDGGYANFNTAEGEDALLSLTTGLSNTAIGWRALYSNTSGSFNTATGLEALNRNTTGFGNTANGVTALWFNTTGKENTAIGYVALSTNDSGDDNTAIGFEALVFNTTGSFNTASGVTALVLNTTGNNNTASGNDALHSNTTGSFNIALGDSAGFNLTTGDNNIDIGSKGVADESNTIRIGTQGTQTAAYIAGISGVTVSGEPVVVDSSGHLGTGAVTPGSVVMLPAAGGVAPPAPVGYSFKGFDLLAAKANGGGGTTSYAVYTKN
jgi:trimeric autotransporter adhesin